MKIERWARAEPPKKEDLRAALEAEGYAVHAWTDERGVYHPRRTYKEAQSHWVVRGAIALEVAGQECVLFAGDRIWLPPGAAPSARVFGDEAVTYLVGSKRPA